MIKDDIKPETKKRYANKTKKKKKCKCKKTTRVFAKNKHDIIMNNNINIYVVVVNNMAESSKQTENIRGFSLI